MTSTMGASKGIIFLPLLCMASLPQYPFAEQTAFQASEPTVIRINMDVPRSKNFLQQQASTPDFNVQYFFAGKSSPQASYDDLIGENRASLDEIESILKAPHAQMVEVPSAKDFVLNIVPPTEDHNLAMKEVNAAIQKARDTNVRATNEFRTNLLAALKNKQFLESKASSSVHKLKQRVAYGGQVARNALNALINLTQFAESKKAMVAGGVLDECAKLLKRESTPNDLKALAGSVITLLTDLPVASTVTDVSSGSNAHVNIVLPSPNRVYHA